MSTNVELFGTKHAPLFVVNIIIFLILVTVSIVLLFCKQLTRFKWFLRFRMMNSLLDVYKAAYKETCYVCTGYQLIIRVALVTTRHLLDKTLHLTITILVIGFAIGVHRYICPFKNRRLNLQELVVIFNAFTVYVLAMFGQTPLFIQIAVRITVFHFAVVLLYQYLLTVA